MKAITFKHQHKLYTVYYYQTDDNCTIDQIYSGAELLYDETSNFKSKNLKVSLTFFTNILNRNSQ